MHLQENGGVLIVNQEPGNNIMNKVEILNKLLALANNNPNEHEANSAARKLCKTLGEMNFQFKSSSQPYQRSTSSVPNYNPTKRQTDWYKDFIRYYTRDRPGNPFRYGGWDSGNTTSESSTEIPKRECTKCHEIKATGNYSDPYICNKCRTKRQHYVCTKCNREIAPNVDHKCWL